MEEKRQILEMLSEMITTADERGEMQIADTAFEILQGLREMWGLNEDENRV